MDNGNKEITVHRQMDIDIAKGIGIILVVWGHAYGPFTSQIINQFHMPFFFFLSGVVFKIPDDMNNFIKKRMKSLLIPFWIYNYILLIPFWIAYYWKNLEIRILLKYATEILITLNKVPMLGATWFLPALFWTSVIIAFIGQKTSKYGKKCNVILLVGSLLFCVIGINVTLPYRISRVLVCQFFFVIGYLYALYFRNKMELYKEKILGLICLITYIFISSKNEVNLSTNQYKYKLLFIIGAILATYTFLIMSKMMSVAHNKIFDKFVNHICFLGRNTMPIIIWQFVFFRIAIFIQIIVYKLPLNVIFSFPYYDTSGAWWILYILSGIYGSLMWDKTIKYCLKKVIIGRKK